MHLPPRLRVSLRRFRRVGALAGRVIAKQTPVADVRRLEIVISIDVTKMLPQMRRDVLVLAPMAQEEDLEEEKADDGEDHLGSSGIGPRKPNEVGHALLELVLQVPFDVVDLDLLRILLHLLPVDVLELAKVDSLQFVDVHLLDELLVADVGERIDVLGLVVRRCLAVGTAIVSSMAVGMTVGGVQRLHLHLHHAQIAWVVAWLQAHHRLSVWMYYMNCICVGKYEDVPVCLRGFTCSIVVGSCCSPSLGRGDVE
mmetsp:Transcript_22490/g.62775  ORF Transcript_22490/g.62775 Transcript_22490/m.62775 type:complete len:255 (+) Transcript_22490:1258-2022(+)